VRLPRDLSGDDLARSLAALGYQVTRQTGSHLRLSTGVGGQHHVTIPRHRSLRSGTLSAILGDVAAHHGIERNRLIERLFG
jgi:predicted RNA binding protein YcfA (HicA-like mRNA interferase family)